MSVPCDEALGPEAPNYSRLARLSCFFGERLRNDFRHVTSLYHQARDQQETQHGGNAEANIIARR